MVALLPLQQPGEESLQSYFGLPQPIIVIWGHESFLNVRTFTRSSGLFRLLGKLGRASVPVRMLVSGDQRLSDEALSALNLFLKHGRGFKYQEVYVHPGYTKWNWPALCKQIGLRWVELVR